MEHHGRQYTPANTGREQKHMDFWEAVRGRVSVRTYQPDRPVPDHLIGQLLAAAIRAPSAGNRQPWHFVVVRDGETRSELALAAYGQSFVAQAPVVIVVCADPDRSRARYGARGREFYCLQDTAAATENLLLAAVALGLGACWVGAFDERAATAALKLRRHLRPVALIPVGYPVKRVAPRDDHSLHPTPRRDLRDVVSYV